MNLIKHTNDVARVLNEGLGTGDIKEYRKRVRDIVKKSNIGFDKLAVDNSGVVTASRTLFYRNGNSSDSIARKLVDTFEADNAKIKVIETADRWKKWPSTSYFVIRFKITFRKPTQSK